MSTIPRSYLRIFLDLTPLHRSLNYILCIPERNLVFMGILGGGWGGGGGHILIPLTYVVLGLAVHLKGPRVQIFSSVRAIKALSQLIPICWPLPLHPEFVHLYKHSAWGMSRLENHTYQIAYVCPQADMV